MTGDAIEALRDREPGEDPDDPYADVDPDELPDWWREAVREFERSGLRPYRPPRFADGELTPVVLEELAAEYGVDVRFVSVGGEYRDDWSVTVDSEVVASIERRRSTEGYTRYGMTSAAFRRLVRDTVDA